MAMLLPGGGEEDDARPVADINVTPLVDVMLVLLVIFIITAPLLASAIRLDLPKTDAAQPGDPPKFVTVVVDKAGQVICVSRENGSVYWIQDLNNTEALSKKQKKKRAKHPILWSTPILANGRLITVSTTGEAVALNAKTGVKEKTLKIGASVLINPIAVGNMIYLVTDEAERVAIR